jgi:hypothetical protein
MHWSERGTSQLLQVRVALVSGDLAYRLLATGRGTRQILHSWQYHSFSAPLYSDTFDTRELSRPITADSRDAN